MKIFLLGLLLFAGSQAHAADGYKSFGVVLAELINRNVFDLNDKVVIVRDQKVVEQLLSKAQSIPDLKFEYYSGAVTHFGMAKTDDVYLADGLFCYKLFARGLLSAKEFECAISSQRDSRLPQGTQTYEFAEMVNQDHFSEMLIHLANSNRSNLQTIEKTEPTGYGDIALQEAPWLSYVRRVGAANFMGASDPMTRTFAGRNRHGLLFCEAPGQLPCTFVKQD